MTRTDTAASASAAELVADSLVWDMVLPYAPEAGNDAGILGRWHDAGVSFVSVHPAGDRHTAGQAVRLIAAARAAIAAEGHVLADGVADVEQARADGRLAVGLHVEGTNMLEGDVALVDVLHRLGIRFCHPVFNLNNAFGGGCADLVDPGLTRFGRRVVEEMNRVGILLDGAHVGERTTLDMIEHSSAPVVFSHVAARAVHDHFRNVSDEQIRACAATGGVVGLTGANFYLGGAPEVELLVRHLDHVVSLVGHEHVGIGFDVVTDTAMLDAYIAARPDEWAGTWPASAFAGPETIVPLVAELLDRGWPADAVRGLLGENFARVCRGVWG